MLIWLIQCKKVVKFKVFFSNNKSFRVDSTNAIILSHNENNNENERAVSFAKLFLGSSTSTNIP